MFTTDFVAGLITGEGTFYLGVQRIANRGNSPRKNRSQGYRITPGFRIVMNDEKTMQGVADYFRNEGLPFHFHTRKDGGLVVGVLGIKRLERIVDHFQPHLAGSKKAAAGIVGEFVASRMLSSPSDNYTDEQLDCVRRLREVNGNKRLPRTPL